MGSYSSHQLDPTCKAYQFSTEIQVHDIQSDLNNELGHNPQFQFYI